MCFSTAVGVYSFVDCKVNFECLFIIVWILES